MQALLKDLNLVDRFLALKLEQEKELQAIVETVAEICETPIGLITVLGERTQTFRFRTGTELSSTPREFAFCNHTMEGQEVLAVQDLTKDIRFNKNPFVTGTPHIRFYAGMPLITHDGLKIGTLCVLDIKPKELSLTQRKALELLGKQVIGIMELEASISLLKESMDQLGTRAAEIQAGTERLQAFLDSSPYCLCFLAPDLTVIDLNRAMEEFVRERYGGEIKRGDSILNFVHPSHLKEFRILCRRALQGKTTQLERLINYDQLGEIWWQITCSPAYDHEQNIIGISYTAIMINDRKEQEQKIRSQHDVLRKILHMQSHGVRRPVANILGLTELMRLKEISVDDYTNMVDRSAHELDDMIRGARAHVYQPGIQKSLLFGTEPG